MSFNIFRIIASSSTRSTFMIASRFSHFSHWKLLKTTAYCNPGTYRVKPWRRHEDVGIPPSNTSRRRHLDAAASGTNVEQATQDFLGHLTTLQVRHVEIDAPHAN